MKKLTVAIAAHVDAGKTTLAEAMLFTAGAIRTAGRVDKKNATLDSHQLEKERGITIFTGEATLNYKGTELNFLDTPGHADFGGELERTLPAADVCLLIISGTEGVQAHTGTVWQLLRHYGLPVVIFVSKMDFARKTEEELLAELNKELSPDILPYRPGTESFEEALSLKSEALLERYLAGEKPTEDDASALIRERAVYPVFFGSGLKMQGIEPLLDELCRLAEDETPGEEPFAAKIYKISYDEKGSRLTHVKMTAGRLKVREEIAVESTEDDGSSDREPTVKKEKITQIRRYLGAKAENADCLEKGSIGCLLGLSSGRAGDTLGGEGGLLSPMLEPMMSYRVLLPAGLDEIRAMKLLAPLSEEDPLLHIRWDDRVKEIRADLMGSIQKEVLERLLAERLGDGAGLDRGRVLYKETLDEAVEGVGHYEPLRHYAEVHLLLEPLPRGTGLRFRTACREEILEKNWQRLVLTHLEEKTHRGVLIGAPITDMSITLVSGRAHPKHTEGGDFRQATYRAVRQGLMNAKSRLLEPYYAFRIELPQALAGRAMSDVREAFGTVSATEQQDERMILFGRAPVTCFNEYATELASYSGGRGRLYLSYGGYGDCHNAEAIIAEAEYRPEADLPNTPDSVFCAHGGGFAVGWREVPNYMHLPYSYKSNKGEDSARTQEDGAKAASRASNVREPHIDEEELLKIMEREFGPIKRKSIRPVGTERPAESEASAETGQGGGETSSTEKTKRPYEDPVQFEQPGCYLIDGYNFMFANDELKELSHGDLEEARNRLMELLADLSGFTEQEFVLVFDGYNVAGGSGSRFDHHGLHVAFTAEGETADMLLEKLAHELGANRRVMIVTSDRLIRLSALRKGIATTSSADFWRQVGQMKTELKGYLGGEA